MTALEWDKPGDRFFETGIDRGVLYLFDGTAVPWNGLTSVSEDRAREVKSYYLDGIKYLDHHVPGAYSGQIQALTYPDELDTVVGVVPFVPGVYLHDQRSQLFHLSYRTKVGNDINGVDHGYKIHILYNLLAVPSTSTLNTIGETTEAGQFEWSLTGTPSSMFGIRPTSHISLHSSGINPALLEEIEELLYGSDEEDPILPTLLNLLALVEGDAS